MPPGLRVPASAVVIGQSPKHGSLLRAHGVVRVVFWAHVPNLMGRTSAHARKTLAGVGLDLGKTPGLRVPASAVVIGQSPKHRKSVEGAWGGARRVRGSCAEPL